MQTLMFISKELFKALTHENRIQKFDLGNWLNIFIGMANDFVPIFETLKALYSAHENECVIVHDEPHRYYLASHEVRATDGYRTDFGGVEIKKAYVSAHLMPIYIYPDLIRTISSGLKKRMQGKSCFNFKKLDPALFDELIELIQMSADRFKQEGRL